MDTVKRQLASESLTTIDVVGMWMGAALFYFSGAVALLLMCVLWMEGGRVQAGGLALAGTLSIITASRFRKE